MALIGTFTKQPDGKYIGTIDTLTIHSKAIFLPNADQGSDKPAYRVFAGKAEIAAAWHKTSERTGADYLSVKFDDPALSAAFFANLIEQDDGTFALLWTRHK